MPNNPVTPRARSRGRKPRWVEPFLTALRLTLSVTDACRSAGCARQTAYERRNKYEDFHEAWELALDSGIDNLEAIAVAMARNQDGQMIRYILSRRRPEKWNERVEHVGQGGGPIKVEQTVHHPDPETLAEIYRIREETGDTEEGG